METQQAVQYLYTVIYEPAEEGGFVVSAPAFGGVITEGDTLEEARKMAKDAIEGIIESYLVDSKPVPQDLPAEPSDYIQEKLSISISVEAQ